MMFYDAQLCLVVAAAHFCILQPICVMYTQFADGCHYRHCMDDFLYEWNCILWAYLDSYGYPYEYLESGGGYLSRVSCLYLSQMSCRYCSVGQCRIRLRNSFRVLSSFRNTPENAEVTVTALAFSTPRICMHVWAASMTTATPIGLSVFWIQSRICTVSLSCTCSLRAYVSTTRAILLSPVMVPSGM